MRELSGVTIPDVLLRVVDPAVGRNGAERRRRGGLPPGVLIERRGSLLFTHFGLSGPAVLDVSRAVTAAPESARCCSWSPIFCRQLRLTSWRSGCAASRRDGRQAGRSQACWRRLAAAAGRCAARCVPAFRSIAACAELVEGRARRACRATEAVRNPRHRQPRLRQGRGHRRRRRARRSRLPHDAKQARAESVSGRRNPRPRRLHRRLQLSGRVQHRLAGGRERLMVPSSSRAGRGSAEPTCLTENPATSRPAARSCSASASRRRTTT